MLTALLTQGCVGVHTNTHAYTHRCGARVRPNSNIFVFPSRTLAGEGEKRRSKRLQARKKDSFAEESERQGKTNGWNQAEARREIGKIRNFIHLYLAITRTLQNTTNAFSFRVSIESSPQKIHPTPNVRSCILQQDVIFLSAHHSQGKGVRTSETCSHVFSLGEHR